MKIKATITLEEETDLASVKITNLGKKITWENLTKEQQIKLVGSMSNFTALFSKFIKD